MASSGAAQAQADDAAAAAVSRPAVADSILELLESMGVREIDDHVVDMLIDFVYSYSKDVLNDAQTFREAAGAGAAGVALRDVELAIRSRGFAQRLSLEMLATASERLNTVDLPAVEERPGLPHPAKGALTMPNCQFGAADDSDNDGDGDGAAAMDATDSAPAGQSEAAQ